ncbi:MAG: ROK family transcriptional regulator [Anaerolineales bacterium]|jgi:predicted NBD/HSP70 family sugar kinase|nr:ROK family transcriptional regulator [Anaerolineales bacterium]
MKKATHQLTKAHNRNLVFQTIYDQEKISRAEIARRTGLTRTTVSELVAMLLSESLVQEVGLGVSQGGKAPVLLSIVPESRCLLALDLAQSEFRGAVVNLRGKILHRTQATVQDRSGEEALALVYQILDYLITSTDLPVVGIGIGTPGLVDTLRGVIINAVNLDWQDVPLADLLGRRYRLPVYVLNDSQAAALGEYTFGNRPASTSSMIVINARQGIGAGIVLQGKLIQGDGGGAGEIGHVVVAPENGERCRCGNIGCLETVASVQALLRKYKANHPLGLTQSISLEQIHEDFLAGKPFSRQIVLETAQALGKAIAHLLAAYNIQLILLTGDMTCFGQEWLQVVCDTVRQNTLPWLANPTRIEFGSLGQDVVQLGASALLLSNYSLLFSQKQTQDPNPPVFQEGEMNANV